MANKLSAIKAFESETLNLLDLAPQTEARKLVINQMIRSLKLAGAWGRLDFLYVWAAADETAALLNWKDPGNYTAAKVADPTFTADRGFTFNGTTQYLTTGFVPSAAVAPSMQAGTPVNTMCGTWDLTENNSNGRSIGVNITSSSNIMIVPRAVSGNNAQFGFNNALGTQAGGLATTSIGLTVGQREADDTVSVYKNGALLANTATAQSGTALPTAGFFIGALNNAGTAANFRATQIAMSFGGARIGGPRHWHFYKALRTYLQAVGAVA